MTMDDARPANSRVLLVSPNWESAGEIQASMTAAEEKREGIGGEERERGEKIGGERRG